MRVQAAVEFRLQRDNWFLAVGGWGPIFPPSRRPPFQGGGCANSVTSANTNHRGELGSPPPPPEKMVPSPRESGGPRHMPPKAYTWSRMSWAGCVFLPLWPEPLGDEVSKFSALSTTPPPLPAQHHCKGLAIRQLLVHLWVAYPVPLCV